MRFTPEQQNAIYAENPELLVSAAAGSGKTAVLVERILHLIADKGLSIDRMLVVTFTRAAAAELRQRLEARLREAAEQDAAMAEQADKAAGAQISTIHVYCTRVLREQFQHCDIDPQFTICETATRARLFEQCLDETLDELYTLAKEDAALAALTDKFTENDIAGMLAPLYEFLLSRPDPSKWLDECAQTEWSEQTIDQSPMAAAFMREAALALDGADSLLADARALADEPGFPDKLGMTADQDAHTLAGLRQAFNGGFTACISALLTYKFAVIARVKPESDDEAALLETFKAYRERYKGLLSDMKKLLPADVPQGVADLKEMALPLRGLCETARRLHERFMAQKRELGEVDFADLEHMTLDVLGNARLREIEQNRFDAVFVDEYQDVSAIQEAILNALKRTGGAPQYFFYVGDVKQSIYRFRLAEPKLFLSKQRDFSTDENAPQRLIVLNRNFRSRKTVLDSVNRVFSHVMDSRVTEIDYDESAVLVPGAPSVGDPPTEVCFIDGAGLKPAQRVVAEATAIARDILRTVGQPVLDAQGNVSGVLHYRDIAILSPVSKNVFDKVEATLRALGVPLYCENASESMESDEIRQVVQHLKLLDNLTDDVALISELRSPLFEMSESELCQIRLTKPEKEASFLEALRATGEQSANAPARARLCARCAEALSLLERERFLSSSMALDEYLWDFLQRSGLYAHYGAQPGGKLRQANLQMLCSLASDHEQNRGDGLRGFLDSLDTSLKVGSGLSPTVVNPWEDVVRLMTIHKSKGLEFSTVYLMGLGGSLARGGQSGKLAFHADLGIGLQYVNETARTKRKTLLQSTISLARKSEELAERARLLYVAMTRAKSRLCLVGTKGADDYGYEDALLLQQSGYTGGGAYAVKSAGSMLGWLAQSVRPWDELTQIDLSTEPMRIITNEKWLSTLSTGFPQDQAPWKVIFHIAPELVSPSQSSKKMNVALPDLPAVSLENPYDTSASSAYEACDDADPVAPKLRIEHHPLKLGVTALCRMQAESAPDSLNDDPETPESKRLPYLPVLPKLLSALPDAPAFMKPTDEEKPLRRGTATHKLLCAVDLDGARAQTSQTMPDFVQQSLARLTESGVFTPEEAADADLRLVSRFLTGDMGARMLLSDTVRREWRFNLRVQSPVPTIAQGVIDLCFLERGGWVLVDFKTDRVRDERELIERYALQLSYYRAALQAATAYPVRECALFSLTLGKALPVPVLEE